MTWARIKPRSKSEWILPAACGALVPRSMVQARHSFLPSRQKADGRAAGFSLPHRISRPVDSMPISCRNASFSSWLEPAISSSVLAQMGIACAFPLGAGRQPTDGLGSRPTRPAGHPRPRCRHKSPAWRRADPVLCERCSGCRHPGQRQRNGRACRLPGIESASSVSPAASAAAASLLPVLAAFCRAARRGFADHLQVGEDQLAGRWRQYRGIGVHGLPALVTSSTTWMMLSSSKQRTT